MLVIKGIGRGRGLGPGQAAGSGRLVGADPEAQLSHGGNLAFVLGVVQSPWRVEGGSSSLSPMDSR